MEKNNIGYKNNELEEKAQLVRSLVRKYLNEKDMVKRTKLHTEVTNISNELAEYLANNYPNKFKNYKFTYKEILPQERFIEINTFNELPKQIKDFWNKIIAENKDLTLLHNLITINYSQIVRYSNRYQDYIIGPRSVTFFIDEDEIYVKGTSISSSIKLPDQFYNFLRRMGLAYGFQNFIYKGSRILFDSEKWPLKEENIKII